MRGNSASASVELAMVTPVFVLFSAAIADFSLAYHQQLQLASALSAGAEYAFTTGQTQSGAALTSAVTNFVQTVSAVHLSSLTASYNGNLVAADYYCVQGTPAVYSGPYAAGAACTDGSGATAGKYVSIAASFSYTALFSFDQVFFPAPLSQSVIVRLQ
jgi:Flp pilus assembly protein TadG